MNKQFKIVINKHPHFVYPISGFTKFIGFFNNYTYNSDAKFIATCGIIGMADLRNISDSKFNTKIKLFAITNIQNSYELNLSTGSDLAGKINLAYSPTISFNSYIDTLASFNSEQFATMQLSGSMASIRHLVEFRNTKLYDCALTIEDMIYQTID